VYVVLGATHPNLIRREGEAYRESLMARVRARGVEEHVVFLNQFVDLTTLLDYISMCDIYVTPYMNEAQMTSARWPTVLGSGKRRIDALLARTGTTGRRTRHSRAVCDARASAPKSQIAHDDVRRRAMLQAGLLKQPFDDLGTNRGALPCRLRAGPGRAFLKVITGRVGKAALPNSRLRRPCN